MSNIVKFPGQEEQQAPSNVVSFPDASQREAVKPTHQGLRSKHSRVSASNENPQKTRSLWSMCLVTVAVLFTGMRYAAAIAFHLSLVLPLAVVSGFRWLICFFSMMALMGTWIVSSVMARHLTEAQHSHVHTIYFVGWGLFILATFAQPLAHWVAEKRIAFRLFGLKGN